MRNTGADYSRLSQHRNRLTAGEVEHCISIAEVMGSNPVGARGIFQVSMRDNCFQISARIIPLFRKLLSWKAFPEADEDSVTLELFPGVYSGSNMRPTGGDATHYHALLAIYQKVSEPLQQVSLYYITFQFEKQAFIKKRIKSSKWN